MIRPYYDDGRGIVIYHGRAEEILPSLDPFELLLTDPPYPKMKGGQDLRGLGGGVAPRYQETKTVATPWGDDITGVIQGASKATLGVLVFCSFHSVDSLAKILPGRRVALLTWYQRNAPPSIQNAPTFQTEFIWAFATGVGLKWRALRTCYDIFKLQAGCMAVERIVDDNGKALHPCQKPLALIGELLSIGPRTVCDPYLGTGTTLLACKSIGIKAVGVECDESHCELSASRLSQEVFDLR